MTNTLADPPTGRQLPRNALIERVIRSDLRRKLPSWFSPASSLARAGLYLRAHGLRMPVWQLAPHLGRKAWLRMFKQA